MKLKALAIAVAACQINAAEFNVNTTSDALDLSPGDGVCLTASSECSLRAAIQEANASKEHVTLINLPNGTYFLDLSQFGENHALTGDLDILKSTTIVGESKENVIIDANQLDRHFDVIESSITPTLTLSNLSLINGISFEDHGGSIRTSGNVTIENVDFSNNRNDTSNNVGYGGAISILAGGNAIIKRTTFTNNNAQKGGAISNEGALHSESNQFSYNTAQHGGAIYSSVIANDIKSLYMHNSAELGGSIYNNGEYVIWDASLSNSSANEGGGVYNDKDIFISKSALDSNNANDGGAVLNKDQATLNYSALRNNFADVNGGGIYSDGDVLFEHSTGLNNEANVSGGFSFTTSNFEVNNSSLIRNNAAIDGGTFYTARGTTNIEFTSLVDDGANSPNLIYTLDGETSLAGSYMESSLTGDVCDLSGFPQKNFSKGYNILSDSSCSTTADDLEQTELYTLDTQGIQTFVVPDNASALVDFYYGGIDKTDCTKVSQNGALRDIEYCDAGAHEQTFVAAQKGIASINLDVTTVSENEPSPNSDNPQEIKIPINRLNGSDGHLSAYYQMTSITSKSSGSSGFVTWEHGDTETKYITLNLVDDNIVEFDETTMVSVTTLNDQATGADQIILTIADDEIRKGTFSFESSNHDFTEGDSVTIKVIRSDYSIGEAELSIDTLNVSENLDDSLISFTNDITFADGEMEKEIELTVNNDEVYLADKMFSLVLSSPDGSTKIGDTNTTTIEVTEDELVPTFGWFNVDADVNTMEGESGSILISRTTNTGTIEGEVTLAISTIDERVAFESEEITFAEGENQKEVSFVVSNNNEYSEVVSTPIYLDVVQQNGGDYTSPAVVTNDKNIVITDDEAAPFFGTFSLDTTSITFNNEGESVQVTINRENGTLGQHVINLTVREGTGSRNDVTITPSTVTFADGETSKTFTLASVIDSTFEEETEELTIVASSDTSGLVLTSNEVTVSLNDGEPDDKVLEPKSGGSAGFLSLLILGGLGLLRRRK